MPASAVEVRHDDGRWYLAELLGQHRDRETGAWRCGARYTVDVGMQYQRVVWAGECRALLEGADQQVGDEERRPGNGDQADGGPGSPAQAWGRHDPR
jgi:hypothetical protein